MKPNKFKDKEYVLRLKKKGCKVYTYRFKGKSLAKVCSYVKTFILESFHDIRWTICENCCEVKRGTHIISE